MDAKQQVMKCKMDTKQVKEIWKPVVRYEGFYEVSSLGRVRSVPRQVEREDGTTATVGGFEMKISTTKLYKSVTLAKNSFRRNWMVHLLILEAFVGPRPPGCKAMFLDCCKTNCVLSNLKWARNEEFKLVYDPTPAQIRAACLEILGRLDERELESRAVQKTARWKVPQYRMIDMPEEFRDSIESVNKGYER